LQRLQHGGMCGSKGWCRVALHVRRRRVTLVEQEEAECEALVQDIQVRLTPFETTLRCLRIELVLLC